MSVGHTIFHNIHDDIYDEKPEEASSEFLTVCERSLLCVTGMPKSTTVIHLRSLSVTWVYRLALGLILFFYVSFFIIFFFFYEKHSLVISAGMAKKTFYCEIELSPAYAT